MKLLIGYLVDENEGQAVLDKLKSLMPGSQPVTAAPPQAAPPQAAPPQAAPPQAAPPQAASPQAAPPQVGFPGGHPANNIPGMSAPGVPPQVPTQGPSPAPQTPQAPVPTQTYQQAQKSDRDALIEYLQVKAQAGAVTPEIGQALVALKNQYGIAISNPPVETPAATVSAIYAQVKALFGERAAVGY